MEWQAFQNKDFTITITIARPQENASKMLIPLTEHEKVRVKVKQHGLCLKLEACGAVYMKQILNKHNMIKNPNWQEADQLAIYKHDRGFELGTTENKFR